jgi:putative PIN family toxin of toxin-antitoxin system
MKIVADTNTVVSAYLWHGIPARVLELHARGWIEICTCPEQLAELGEVLQRPKFYKRLALALISPAEIVAHFSQLKDHVVPAKIDPTPLTDLKDTWVLGCAHAADAHAIVSGDKHLLDLHIHRGIPIYRPAEFVAFFDFARSD